MLRVQAWVLFPNALKRFAFIIVVLEESSSEISNLWLYEILNSTNSWTHDLCYDGRATSALVFFPKMYLRYTSTGSVN